MSKRNAESSSKVREQLNEKKPRVDEDGEEVPGLRHDDLQTILNRILMEDLQSTNADLVAKAADELLQIAGEGKNFNELFKDAGGYSILLSTVNKWKENEAIQEGLLDFLACFCTWEGCPRRALINLRGVDMAWEAMQRFPHLPSLQADCMVISRYLCEAKDSTTHGQVCHSVGRFDGVTLVYATMKAAPNDRLVQHEGLLCLKSLCKMKIEKETFKATKGEAVSLVGIFLQNFPDDADAADEACSFLNSLRSVCGFGCDVNEEGGGD